MAEMLLAEMIFLYSAPKRKGFPLIYTASVIICLVLSYLFPMPEDVAIRYNVFYSLFRFIFLFALTVVGMGVSFKISINSLIAACVAGYATQHIAYNVVGLVSRIPIFEGFDTALVSRLNLFEFIVVPLVYVILFFTFGRISAKNEHYKKSNFSFNILSISIVFICVGLTRFSRAFEEYDSTSVKIYSIVSCLLALVVQFIMYRLVDLRQENEAVKLLWQEEKKQYEISKKTIELINIKCHDLKHKLSAFEGRLPADEIQSMKDAVQIYDSVLKTGNEALDVLLTEHSLHCAEEGIRMTYMGNGADLSFMKIMDVYSLFGNAVSNAIEAVRKLSDNEKKVIDIVLESKGDFVTVNISNFFDGVVVFEDGVPQTVKKQEEGYHGFGMKSMQLIAEKYGGSVQATAEGAIFTLCIYLLSR